MSRNMGHEHSEETKRKLKDNIHPNSLANLRPNPYFKVGHKLTKEAQAKRTLSLMGNQNGKGRLGRKHTEEAKRKISDSLMGKKSELSRNWKGGITPEHKKIRNLIKSTNWRMNILKRDKFTCQNCGRQEAGIHAHHIKPFAKYPMLRYETNNGLTLCKDCHNQTHRQKVKEDNYVAL